MSNACSLAPTIRGKRSELYVKLYNKTGKNRPLTNFLYGISKVPSVLSSFNKKELSSQGEPTFRAFSTHFNLDSILADASSLQEERRDIGAVNAAGEEIAYDTPNDLYQKVVDYNKVHNKFHAKIKFRNGKFFIDLNIVDASNYNANRSIESRKAAYDSIVNYLADNGFSTTYSDSTIAGFMNFINVFPIQDTLIDMINVFQTGDIYKMNPRVADFMLESLSTSGNAYINYLLDTFGSDAGYLVAYLSGYTYEQESMPDEILDMLDTSSSVPRLKGGSFVYNGEYIESSYVEDAVKVAIKAMNTTLSKLDSSEIRASVEAARQGVENTDPSYLGVSSSDIYSSLKDLYDTFPFIDKETVDLLDDKISMLSEAATAFLNKRRQEAHIMQVNRDIKAEDRADKVAHIQREINKGRYAESIVTMMEEVSEELKSQLLSAKALENYFKTAPDALSACNQIAGFILNIIKLYNGYSDVLEKLMKAETLGVDELDVPADMLGMIADAAKELHSDLSDAMHYARDLQFESVYNFLKIYWGDSDTREVNGELKSLRDLLKIAEKDVGILDRFIYAVNECSDEVVGLLSAAIKDRHRDRNKKLEEIDYIVRTITESVNGNTAFMYERDANNVPTGKIISPVDFNKFEQAKQAERERLKAQGYSGKKLSRKMAAWELKHTETVAPFTNLIYKNAVKEYVKAIYGDNVNTDDYFVEVRLPKLSEFGDYSALDALNTAQKNYYYRMMALKTVLSYGMPDSKFSLFDAVQISADMMTAFKESGGDPSRLLKMMKNKVGDFFQRREDDDSYGEDLEEILSANGIEAGLADLEGHELMRLPLFFTHKLSDMTRLSTDFSRSILAYATSTTQYNEMNKILDAMMLAKDWIAGDDPRTRKIAQDRGGNKLMDIFTFGHELFAQSIYKGSGANTKALLDDFYERNMYGRLKKKEGSVFGVPIDKLADTITGYTSVKGLSLNVLGAQANALVGKIQMIIEASAGEFFNLGDFAVAELKYFQLLPELLIELHSNNKSSKLALLMDRFDVTDDYMRSLKDKGFYDNPISKILGSSNLLFMYGMGEHMLHAETMLAVLNHCKVFDTQLNEEVSILNAYDVVKEEGSSNGRLVLNTDRYKWLEKNNGETTYRNITREDEKSLDKNIAYCNHTMHGAFGELEKGMAHRYAFMRLVLNFRQWMPGHYERRFRGNHLDADLGKFREGYYTTLGKFAWETLKDLKDAKFQVATRWHELDDTQLANMRRAAAETIILIFISTSIWHLGKYKDKKRNRFYRDLLYQLYRMQMEVKASTPISADGFIKNIFTMLNSPIASLNTIEGAWNLLNVSNLFESVENGSHEGEIKYFHDLENLVPVRQVRNQWNIDKEDYLFQMFDTWNK